MRFVIVLYLDDKLPSHPKIFKAGQMLGADGGAKALAVFVAGLAYARGHLTDGWIPEDFVKSCSLVSRPHLVANALTSKAVRLWHKRPGGYLIHDYLDWNRKASVIKENREKERLKKARQRAGKNGHE